MLSNYLTNTDIAFAASKLCKALLKQEACFLSSYSQGLNSPEYLSYTDDVNEFSCQLASLLSDQNYQGVFTHKITLVDEEIMVDDIANSLNYEFPENFLLDVRSPQQLVCFTTQDTALSVKDTIYKKNHSCGIISLFNMVERTKRPYILGLHSWDDARNVEAYLDNFF